MSTWMILRLPDSLMAKVTLPGRNGRRRAPQFNPVGKYVRSHRRGRELNGENDAKDHNLTFVSAHQKLCDSGPFASA